MADSKLSSSQKEILSGFTAGFISTIVTHPLDILKIRLQLDQTSSPHIKSLHKALRSLHSDSIITTFKKSYRGILPNLIGSSAAWAIYFASYRHFKDQAHKLINSEDRNSDSNLTSWHYLGCSFGGGMLAVTLTNPFWVLKTRILSTNRDVPGAYNGIADGVQRILKEEGILGFWKGLVPGVLGIGQGALQFAIYDTLKYQFRNDDSTSKLQIWEYIAMSCTSKIVSQTILYPCQLLKSRLQNYDSIQERKNMSQVIKQTWINEGFGGFYKGMVPSIIRVLPATCITFGLYEQMKKIT